MNRISFALAAAVLLAGAAAAAAQDSVRTTSTVMTGNLTQMSPQEVVVERAGMTRTLPANEIVSITFANEPAQLRSARAAVTNGRFEEALKVLDGMNVGNIGRAEVRQEIEYLGALAAARLALAGRGDVAAAGTRMTQFVTRNPQHYRFIEGNLLVGDLLVAMERFEAARTYYAAAAEAAPSPDLSLRAEVAAAGALLAEGRADEALSAFDRVLAVEGENEALEAERATATLGRARALAEQDRPDEAVALVEKLLDGVDAEDRELNARAYNALGTAHRKAGRTSEALLAFLHVDILFPNSPEAHAEALANLVELWEEVRRSDRAAEARQVLRQRYENSRFAQQVL